MQIPEVLRSQTLFKVPLTVAHYGLIGLRRMRLTRNFPPPRAVSPDAVEIVRKLKRDGWAIIPDLIPAQDCSTMRDDIDALIAAKPDNLQSEYAGAEHRYFGAEDKSELVAKYHDNALLREVSESYLETQIANIATLAGKSLPAHTEGNKTGRWHRDSFGRQIKAIAYLSDVNENSGPFEFIAGSHRLGRIATDLRKGGLKLLQWRLSDEDVARVVSDTGIESTKVTAKVGTVVLVDTSCIHRAMPITDGVRYAITNYYVERGRYRPEIAKALKVPFRPEETNPVH